MMNRTLLVINALLLIGTSLVAQQPQTGAVTGILRSTTGEPAPGVRVAATALPDPATGTGEGTLVSQTQTDRTGRYRLDNILPGRYYIQAGLVDFPTYYPGVAATAGAKSLLIGAGAVLESIDFTLSRAPGVRVSGRVPLSAGRISLTSMSGGAGGFRATTSQVRADGTFEFLRVPPGNYTISALPNNGLLPNLPVVVSDKDIDVGLPPGPGVKVSGVVGLGSQSPRPAGQKVVLTGASAWAQIEAAIDAGGKFEIATVPPGSYTVRTLPGNSAPSATVVVGDREVAGVRVPAYAELIGHVGFQDGRKLPAFSTALTIEAKPPQGISLATLVRADGTFRFPLAEGEYRISFGKLPTGLSVKSITYGAVDLLIEPLKLDGEFAVREFRITLETKP
jgi:hypothetical protein